MSTKSKLLSYLKQKKGTWASGEFLSDELAVSRSAVWKHVRALKAEGYSIESSPRKGYLFRESPDLFLVEEIRDGLDTTIFGKQEIFCFKEIDSTNLKARELALGGAPEGTLIIAETQTSGRGRRGRNWFSPVGQGLYASLILRPPIPPSEAPKIVLLMSVAVAELLRVTKQLPTTIKWPNDILVEGKKIAGILMEIGTEMDAVNYVIVGCGLNVNIPYESFPHELKDNATSVLIETGESASRIDVIQGYLACCEKYYGMFINGRSEEIIRRWKELTDIIGRRVRIDLSGRTYAGEVSHIDEDGTLGIRDSEGKVHRVFSGDLTVVRT